MVEKIIAWNAKYRFIVPLLVALTITLFALPRLSFYLRFDFNFILLLLAIPFVLRRQSNAPSLRYGFAALILLLLFILLKLSTIFFLAWICGLFFLYESRYGKLSTVPLLLIIAISPVVIFLTEVLGFELRLWLTSVAVNILQLVIPDVSHSGNIINFSEGQFHVDKECMGLNMVLLTIFICLIFITYQQKKQKIRYNFVIIILCLLGAYGLAIISNLVRIILITLFRSPPGTFSHEAIGIICFIAYVVLPMAYLIKRVPSKTMRDGEPAVPGPGHGQIIVFITASLVVFFGVLSFLKIEREVQPVLSQKLIGEKMHDFKATREDHGVIKLSNEELLIYLKPPARFFSSDHSPLICWKGSGYVIKGEQIIQVEDKKVYFNELQQNGDKLYSTWWYDCKDDVTISQLKWRWDNLLYGKQYKLVNVVSYDKEITLAKTAKYIESGTF